MEGFIHSVESFGTVDGPGIRLVVFLQGCPMRCKYCHNPDTWKIQSGKSMTAEEILTLYRKNQAFYQSGGITVTGGEPLLQTDFLIELFTLAKQQRIHTCIDTSGVTYRPGDEKLEKLLTLTDLVLLDLKHMDPDIHKELTGHTNDGILAFARHLDQLGIPVWVRHVVIPGITDEPDSLKALGHFLATLHNVKALDVLPYHTMGVDKYRELGIQYPLAGVAPLPKENAKEARKIILDEYKAKKLERSK